jgi:predicted enzyme related to lactoylglutathione lyase
MHHPRRDLVLKIVLASFLLCASGVAAPLPPAIQYVGAISINPSHDTKVVADWYQTFGFDLHFDGGGYYGFFKTPAGPFYLAIHPRRADAPKESSSSVSIVFRVNDYDGYVSMLKKQGLEAQKVESDATGHFAHYTDPDGNKITVWGD